MRKYGVFLCAAMLVVSLAACGGIKQYAELIQPTDQTLSALPGTVVMQINRSRDLKNALGGADIAGGKVDAGTFILRFQGVTEEGKVIFHVTDIVKTTDETTMDRYGSKKTTLDATARTTGSASGSSYGGQSNVSSQERTRVTGTVTESNTRQVSVTELPPHTREFVVNPATTKSFSFEGYRFNILNVNEISLEYTITKIVEKTSPAPKQAPVERY